MIQYLSVVQRTAHIVLVILAAGATYTALQPVVGIDSVSEQRTATDRDQDPTVWVNTKSHVYHCPGTRYYGSTKSGTYMPESTARARGHRPAYGKLCGSAALWNPKPDAQTKGLAQVPGSATKVWVNTASRVYHCPGSQYYGNTKRGQFVTETEARASGARPAYGKPCR